jgi:hypothetical protein
MWKSKPGRECIIHMNIRPDGRIAGVVVQTDEGFTPKVGGEVLPGRWPGMVGAAKKALLTHTREETPMGDTSKAQWAERKLKAEALEAEAKARKAAAEADRAEAEAGSRVRHQANFNAQDSHWDMYGRHKTERNTYVKKVSGHPGGTYLYVAVLHGEVIGHAKGRYGNRTRSAAKGIVTKALNS